jgi:hypothetical protein
MRNIGCVVDWTPLEQDIMWSPTPSKNIPDKRQWSHGLKAIWCFKIKDKFQIENKMDQELGGRTHLLFMVNTITLRIRNCTLGSITWAFLIHLACKERRNSVCCFVWALTYNRETGVVLTSQRWPYSSSVPPSVDPPQSHLPLSMLQAETVEGNTLLVQNSDMY